MQNYLNELQEKYGYNNQLVEVLAKIIPKLIEYFGEENKELILNAINDCEIHIQQPKENVNKYLSEFFESQNNEKFPIAAAACYDSRPIIKAEQMQIKRLIYLKESCGDFSKEKNVSLLVHELLHLIKSYKNEFLYNKEGKIIQRSGLAETILEFNKEDNNVKEISNKNTGIEETVNCYDESQIMSMIFEKDYTTNSYPSLIEPGRSLLKHKNIRDAIRDSQLNADNNYIELIGKDIFEFLTDSFEKIYATHFLSFSQINTKEKRMKIKENRQKVIDSIIEFCDKYKPNEMKQRMFGLETIREIVQDVTAKERQEGQEELKKIVLERNDNEKAEKQDENMIQDI